MYACSIFIFYIFVISKCIHLKNINPVIFLSAFFFTLTPTMLYIYKHKSIKMYENFKRHLCFDRNLICIGMLSNNRNVLALWWWSTSASCIFSITKVQHEPTRFNSRALVGTCPRSNNKHDYAQNSAPRNYSACSISTWCCPSFLLSRRLIRK